MNLCEKPHNGDVGPLRGLNGFYSVLWMRPGEWGQRPRIYWPAGKEKRSRFCRTMGGTANGKQVVIHLLPRLEQEGQKFDVVILDPPAFTKSRNSIKNAVKGYREINLRGMKLVKDGGYLATCSCSHFMDPELFTKTIREAAGNVHKRLRQVEYRTQASDHPILWAADESYYLKFYIFQVCDEK